MYNELYHHGVKGMKWGIRRYYDSNGQLTDAGYRKQFGSKRSLDRRIRKMQSNNQNKNQQKVLNSVSDQLNNSKEGKAYRNLNENLTREALSISKRYGISPNKVAISDPSGSIERINTEYAKRARIIAESTLGDYAGATLRDLGYEDTKGGRDYLIRKGIVKL